MGVILVFSLIQTLYLIGVWFVEDRLKEQTPQRHIFNKNIGLHLQFELSTPHSIVNTFARIYVFGQEINKHALLITMIQIKGCLISNPNVVDASS